MVIILFPKSFLRIPVIVRSHLTIQNMLLARSSVLQEFLVQIFQMGGRGVLLGHLTSNQGFSLAKDNHKGHLLCFPGLAQSFLSKVRKSLLKSNQLFSNSQSRINAFPFSGINPNIYFVYSLGLPRIIKCIIITMGSNPNPPISNIIERL